MILLPQNVGAMEGGFVGDEVGIFVGLNVGAIVGVYVSTSVGGFIGENVGVFVDIFVGADECTLLDYKIMILSFPVFVYQLNVIGEILISYFPSKQS